MPAGLKIYPATGGITNRLNIVELPGYPKVLVRLFGPHTAAVINRQSELVVAKFISKKRVGPRVFGTFKNGRVEGFIEGAVSLTPQLMLDHSISRAVAVAVATLHTLGDPVHHIQQQQQQKQTAAGVTAEPEVKTTNVSPTASNVSAAAAAALNPHAQGSLWKAIDSWMKLACTSGTVFTGPRKDLYDSLDLPRMQREVVELRALLSQLEEPTVFCHNDLLSGNILHIPTSPQPEITLIDFEYGSMNYRAFDIANHFCECCGFDCDWNQFPDERHQRNFIRAYLTTYDRLMNSPSAHQADSVQDAQTTTNDAGLSLDTDAGIGAIMNLMTASDETAASALHEDPLSPFPLSPLPPPSDASSRVRKTQEHFENVDPILEARVEVLRRRTLGFVLASHIFWGTWAVVMAANAAKINFDYLSYAKLRYDGYFMMKQKCLLAMKPVLESKLLAAERTSTTIPTPAPLRAGIVGYGVATKFFHAPIIAASAGIMLKGVVCRDESKHDEALAQFSKLNNYFGLSGMHIDTEPVPDTDGTQVQPATQRLPINREIPDTTSPCKLSAEESLQYLRKVVSAHVNWRGEYVGNGLSRQLAYATFTTLSTTSVPTELIPFVKYVETVNRPFPVKAFNSIEAMLNAESEDSVDLVVIATPSPTHFELGKTALLAGKHVVIDKPAAVTVPQINELIAIAKTKKVFLGCYQNRRFDGDFLSALRNMPSIRPEITAPHSKYAMVTYRDPTTGVTSQRCETPLGSSVKWVEVSFQKGVMSRPWGLTASLEEGGGRLWDLGTHATDQALALMTMTDSRRPVSVFAKILREVPEAPGMDSHCHITINFDDNSTAIVDVGSLAAVEKPRFYLVGDAGTYVKSGFDPQEGALMRGYPASAAVEPTSEHGTIYPRRIDRSKPKPAPIEDVTEFGRWPSYYDQIAAHIRTLSYLTPKDYGELTTAASPQFNHDTRVPAPVPIQETRALTAVLEAALESAKTGSIVKLPEGLYDY